MTKLINPSSLPAPRGYNNGLLFPVAAASGVLFVAGQIAWDTTGRIVGGSFAEQFDRALENVVAVVRGAGGAPESIGKLTIFVVDRQEYLAEREAVGRAYRRHMGRHFPAMTLVEVKALVDEGARVEIEGVAILPAPGAPGSGQAS